MSWYGTVALNGFLDVHFTTRRFTTGAPFTLGGAPVVSAYADNSLGPLTTGLTLTVNLGGVVGLNHVRILATGANGYTEGAVYDLVLTAGTVDGTSVVGEVVGSFRVQTPVVAPPPTSSLASSGGMEPELAAMLTETVSHAPYISQDGYGSSVYGPATLRACKVEFKVGPMITQTGEERTSSTRIFFNTDFTLQLRDRIVLEDGTAPQIQMLYKPRNEFGAVHHQEALF